MTGRGTADRKETWLLALDLDGTAVRDDYHMSEADRQAIRTVRETGCVTAYVTGRRDVDMRNLETESRCTDYLILNGGGKIISESDGKIFYNHLIKKEDCEKLIKHCLEKNLMLHVCHGELWMVPRMTKETMEYSKDLGVKPIIYHTLEDIPYENGLEGFMTIEDVGEISSFIESSLPGVSYIMSEPDCIDIFAAGIRKWDGIIHLADRLGIDRNHIIAVGNYYNDLDMIRNAAIGIAVANAPDDVKTQADYVTARTNNEDVIEEIAERFFR